MPRLLGRSRSLSLIVVATLGSTAALTAQYGSDFEALEVTASPTTPFAPALWDPSAVAGTPGQDGYYLPANTTSAPFNAQFYTGGAPLPGLNDYGIPDNPNGGAIFIVGEGPASPTFARAQRDMPYGCDRGVWTFATDICAKFVGTLPTAQNLGSLSAQPFPGGQSFIMLARWTDTATAATWNADYIWFDSAGTQLTESVGDPAFQNLLVDSWYRWETDVDLTNNQVLEVRITDLSSAIPVTTTFNPVDRYLEGGSAGAASPTGFRFFAGGTVAGNVLAFDNVAVLAAGSVDDIPGCTTSLAGTLAVAGSPVLGSALTIDVDGPNPPVTTPGQSVAGVAFSLTGDPNLPCGTPLPGVTGNLLIGIPPGATLISTSPWTGPGNPVSFPFAIPNTPLNGVCIYVQGALLDVTTGGSMATSAARIVIGG